MGKERERENVKRARVPYRGAYTAGIRQKDETKGRPGVLSSREKDILTLWVGDQAEKSGPKDQPRISGKAYGPE